MAQIAAYAFNEGTGTTAAEIAGGTSITGVPGWAAGRHGNAMFINVTTGPTISPYSSNTAFTIMFDVYIVGNGSSGYNIFISNTAGVGNVQCDSSGNFSWYHDTADPGILGVISTATWTNVAVVADGTTRKAYLNGTQVGSWANTSLSTTGAVKIGGELSGGYASNFRIDNLRFHNTALSAAEISALQGTAVGIEARTVNLSDGVGITDAASARSDTMTVNLSDSLGIRDTDAPLALENTLTFADNVGATDAMTPSGVGGGIPTANAGPDQIVNPGTLVTLNGSASSDPGGSIVTYTWTQVSGTAVALAGSGATRTFTPPDPGTYVFGLRVTDNSGNVSLQDTVTITASSVLQRLVNGGYVPYIIVSL